MRKSLISMSYLVPLSRRSDCTKVDSHPHDSPYGRAIIASPTITPGCYCCIYTSEILVKMLTYKNLGICHFRMRLLINDRLHIVSADQFVFPQQAQQVDMHIHTTFSDGMASVAQIAAKSKLNGYGVAITDHNEILGSLELSNNYPDIFSIPGIEVSAQEGIHFLVYFPTPQLLTRYYETYIKPFKQADNFYILNASTIMVLRGAREMQGLIIAAHPYGAGATGLCRALHDEGYTSMLLDMVDGIEILNGGVLRNHNTKAVRLCQVTEFGICGGSDAHSLAELGSVRTYAYCDKTPQSFIEAISTNKCCVAGKESGLVRKPYSRLRTIRNFTRHPIRYTRHATTVIGKQVRSLGKDSNNAPSGI